MFRCVVKSCLIVCLSLWMFATLPLAYASGHYGGNTEAKEKVPGEVMILDLVVLRPLGLAATVIGTVALVVSLPFTLPTRQLDVAVKTLVVKPGKYTFVRPLGYATE